MFVLAIEILKEKTWCILFCCRKVRTDFRYMFLLWEDGTFQWRCPCNGIQSNIIHELHWTLPPGDSDSHRSLQSWLSALFEMYGASIFGGSTPPPGWRYIIEATMDSKVYFNFLLFAGGRASQCTFFLNSYLVEEVCLWPWPFSMIQMNFSERTVQLFVRISRNRQSAKWLRHWLSVKLWGVKY